MQINSHAVPQIPHNREVNIPRLPAFLTEPLRYPRHYFWFVFASALDLILTWTVLHFGGAEVNRLADRILERGGLPAIVVYKFGLVMLVILICQIVGRTDERRGRLLACSSVAITAFPVLVGVAQLATYRSFC